MRTNDDGRWIETFSGDRFFPLSPGPAEIHIKDIAHGLAGRFRFSGQSRDWYTVAQHSVEVSRRVPAEDVLWGLLHDAAEAYLPDIPRPIKDDFCMSDFYQSYRARRPFQSIRPFEAFEWDVLECVAMRFGLRMPIPASVLEADDRELPASGGISLRLTGSHGRGSGSPTRSRCWHLRRVRPRPCFWRDSRS